MFNAVFGIYVCCYSFPLVESANHAQNLAKHDHSVLKAFSPFFAGEYLVRNGTDGWKALGGILLAFTGVEALFADLGAFSQRSVHSFTFFYLANYISELSRYRGCASPTHAFCLEFVPFDRKC